jgi:glycosyltransferase involved in cell wall biosynthesis
MNIIALGSSEDHVCIRYRIEPIRERLRAAGHWFTIQGVPRGPLRRLSWYGELARADVVIFQRRLLPPREVTKLRRAARYLIFDFDDAIFQRDSYQQKLESPRRLARFQAMVQAADQVFAGNDYLAEVVSQHTSSAKVTVVPTCLDVNRYDVARHEREGEGVRLAWIGSASTLRGLELKGRLWNALGRALPGVELHVICDRFPTWEDIKVVPVPWRPGIEYSYLASCDIGLAWMPDDSWSKGKCGLKVTQCMAAGLPMVGNPIGVHTRMIRPGETGFLARTEQEWIDSLRRLRDDALLRRRLGQAGRAVVEQSYSHERLLRHWNAALRGVELARDLTAA